MLSQGAMMASSGWDGQDHHMAQPPDDEFQQFLDISGMGDEMQFDFNGFHDSAAQSMMDRQREEAQVLMNSQASNNMMNQQQGMIQNQPSHMNTSGPGPQQQMMPTSAPGSETISNIDAQIQYLQQQKFHQQQRQLQEQRNAFYQTHHHTRSIPPTPQSLELASGTGQFYGQSDQMPRDVYDRSYNHQRIKEQQDMAFTPLVSPAVTPLDPHFMENAFTVPGAYFSPLTSPALHAQNDTSSLYDHSTQSNNSPAEMDLESTPAPVASALDLPKKARKANAAAKVRGKSGIKSSPITKPQRRKAGPSPAIVSQVLGQVDEKEAENDESNLLPMPAASTEGSEENASVSPENLTEMPPPPVPARRSTSKSPYIQAQSTAMTTPTQSPSTTLHVNGGSAMELTNDQPHPATPASLMRLPASRSKNPAPDAHEQIATDNIESLELPESVSKKPLPRLDTQTAPQGHSRLESNSAKPASLQPLSSPVFRRPGTTSANQSPLMQPGSTGPTARKMPNIAPRASRKRSTGSVHVSPALLPRISPNIKPLLPGAPGESAEDTASRLLMSKSNYQNILEGNTVPGVSYPSELSTNLTSKRTSHKIAEQGRRNRINSALHIMAGLLPDQKHLGSGDESDKKDSKQANAANSKASVVEKAIVHMQNLEQENVDLKKEVQDLREKLEQMKGTS